MFLILDSMADTCNSYVLFRILDIIKICMGIIHILGPILAIVGLTINFILLTVNPNEKKYQKGIYNCLLATLFLFLMPFFINLTMHALGDNTTISDCWNNVETIKEQMK